MARLKRFSHSIEPEQYPIIGQKIIELMYEGKSIHEVCRELRISYLTLKRYMESPDGEGLKKDFELALAYAQGWWEKTGRENLYNKDFNSALFFMHMRNRFGWTNSDELISQNATGKIVVEIKKFCDEGSKDSPAT